MIKAFQQNQIDCQLIDLISRAKNECISNKVGMTKFTLKYKDLLFIRILCMFIRYFSIFVIAHI